jgi:two-component system CheB/CheR fusion protein
LYTEAQRAIILRNDFISLASHELKTPITSLKMYIQALDRQYAKQGEMSLQTFFAKIDRQINKLSLLINDLLDISKIQHGKLEFSMDAIDLTSLVKDTVDAVQEMARKHTITVEGEIKKKVYADQDRIYQVLTNLLTNAIKYSPKADNVIVRLVPEKEAAVVTVQDFGIGIDSNQQKKIFNQFYRVENTEQQTFPGLGMGLYISQEIIKRHNGLMRVVSSKGEGSQFTFTLPYSQ